MLVIGYGHAPFTASFFLRVHSEEIARLASMFELKSVGFMGLALGLMGGTAGMISAWLGGQSLTASPRRTSAAMSSFPPSPP